MFRRSTFKKNFSVLLLRHLFICTWPLVFLGLFLSHTAYAYAPVFVESSPQAVTMDEDGAPIPFALTLNATDGDGDSLTWTILTAATNGAADVTTGTGSFQDITYTPTANYNGSGIADSFTVQVDDGLGGSATLTVDVTVRARNDAPSLDAIADPAAILEDALEQTISLSGITAGGGESQALAVTAASDNTALVPDPTVTYSTPGSTGSLAYTPVSNQSGSALITVTVTDAGLDGAAGTGDDGTVERTFTVEVVNTTDLKIQQIVDRREPGVNDQGEPDENDQVVFTITVTNYDPSDATDVHVTDILPSGLNYVTDDSEGTYNPTTGEWNIGLISAAGSEVDMAVLHITAKVNHDGEIVSIASVKDSQLIDKDTSDNSSGLILNGGNQADLAIDITVDKPYPDVGESINFSIRISNNGLDDATGYK
jgi:uncharacterized repeat protein (TIGR01451 family)